MLATRTTGTLPRGSPLWDEEVEGSFEEEVRQAGLLTVVVEGGGQTAKGALRSSELTCSGNASTVRAGSGLVYSLLAIAPRMVGRRHSIMIWRFGPLNMENTEGGVRSHRQMGEYSRKGACFTQQAAGTTLSFGTGSDQPT